MTKNFRKTPFEFQGLKGVVVHDKLIADGPVDETGKPLINPETGKRYPGKNDDMARILLKYLSILRGQSVLAGDSRQSVASFGVLTHLAQTTPIYLYDHPALTDICETAFTDGVGVFVNADFMRNCVEQESSNQKGVKKFGVLPVLVHELLHKLLFHNTRMKDIPHGIANRAQDRHINALYRKAWGSEMPLIPMLVTILESGTEASSTKYESMSEEIIGRNMMQEYAQRREEIMQKHGKKKKSGGGSGGSGGSGGGSGSGSDDFDPDQDENGNGSDGDDNESSDSLGKGKSSKGKGKGGSGEKSDLDKELEALDNEFSGDRHHITAEEMIKILEEEGLTNLAKALEYPTSKDDKEGLEKLLEKSNGEFDRAVQKSMIEMNRLPDPSKYPGAHIATESASKIRHLRKNKIKWQMDFANTVIGDGPAMKITEDETTPVYYLKFGEGMEEIYDPALINQKNEDCVVVIFDTSGSTSQGDLREKIASEILGMIDSFQGNENAKEVLLVSGDTVLRGEPMIIDRGNIELVRKEGLSIFGNGGTDIANCIRELFDSKMIKDFNRKIKHIVYVTDCEDNVPPKSVLGDHADNLTFTVMSTRNCYSEKWDQELTWGKVVFIEDGASVSLDLKERQSEQENKNRKTAMAV